MINTNKAPLEGDPKTPNPVASSVKAGQAANKLEDQASKKRNNSNPRK